MLEKLARFLARWYTVWQVGTSDDTLASKNVKLARVLLVGTKAHWHVNHTGTQAWWFAERAETQTRMTRDLANFDNKNVLLENALAID